MNWTALSAIGSLLQGVVGVLALVTILLLLRQTREMTTQTRLAGAATVASLYQDIANRMTDLDLALVDHSELRPYFYDGKEISKADQYYDRAMSMAEAYLDFMDLVIVMEKVAPTQSDTAAIPWADWKGYFRDIYNSSPVMRDFWGGHGKWYSNTLADVLNR